MGVYKTTFIEKTGPTGQIMAHNQMNKIFSFIQSVYPHMVIESSVNTISGEQSYVVKFGDCPNRVKFYWTYETNGHTSLSMSALRLDGTTLIDQGMYASINSITYKGSEVNADVMVITSGEKDIALYLEFSASTPGTASRFPARMMCTTVVNLLDNKEEQVIAVFDTSSNKVAQGDLFEYRLSPMISSDPARYVTDGLLFVTNMTLLTAVGSVFVPYLCKNIYSVGGVGLANLGTYQVEGIGEIVYITAIVYPNQIQYALKI